MHACDVGRMRTGNDVDCKVRYEKSNVLLCVVWITWTGIIVKYLYIVEAR
jgi:hypothetical protein